ncbi:YpmS family protein [Salisediminibacterium selenitireducens]|uniref:DUF2140 family protein n=1 Tax=Bacillus selenitireducens (strain ATCC 700615 / DSM 15326 / MLS10) TaxID=439292 RepID=D6XX14_BACIE|nr:YpmS family protein [Salisediminibacterium selenitireducens]ADH99990.1 Protein of unknown function DUF2140 [[Bacillus] selenitireducens MLS10]
MEKKTINLWKWAFLILCLALVLTFAGMTLVYLYAVSGSDREEWESPVYEDSDGAVFEISTTKDDINLWIEQEMRAEGEENFQLYLDDYMYVETTVDVFGLQVPVDLRLIPEVTEDGNLVLIEDRFRIAGFSLPSEQVFRLIRATADLPDWIDVIPESSEFYIDLREAASDGGVDLRIVEFDLAEERLLFEATFLVDR